MMGKKQDKSKQACAEVSIQTDDDAVVERIVAQPIEPAKDIRQVIAAKAQRVFKIQQQDAPNAVPTAMQLAQDLGSLQMIDRAKAFEMFRKSYRKNEVIEKGKQNLKAKIDEAKSIAVHVNDAKTKLSTCVYLGVYITRPIKGKFDTISHRKGCTRIAILGRRC